jgi:N6-adenosine-specific RNA methylase IME4
MEQIIAQNGFFKPTATGLVITGEPPYEIWEAYGKKLRFVEGAIAWLVGDWLNYGELHYGELYAQALDAGAPPQTWMNYKWVAGRFETSRRREVVSFTHHSEVAALDPEIADALLSAAAEKHLSSRDLRTLVRHLRHQNLLADAASLTGKYQVFYADPPWRYDFPLSDSRAIENQYPTMELEEICALEIGGQPVQELAEKDSIVFLWCPPAFTKKAIMVLEAWGFEYRTNAVWVKPSIGPGQWVRQRHELLMIGVRGDMPTPMGENKPDSVIEAAREEHSKKPDVVYDIIEKMYPDFKKLELFARGATPRENWCFWGNQA